MLDITSCNTKNTIKFLLTNVRDKLKLLHKFKGFMLQVNNL